MYTGYSIGFYISPGKLLDNLQRKVRLMNKNALRIVENRHCVDHALLQERPLQLCEHLLDFKGMAFGIMYSLCP